MNVSPVVVTISLRPGFSLAVKVSCWVALIIALASPSTAGRFVDRTIAVLTRIFVRVS